MCSSDLLTSITSPQGNVSVRPARSEGPSSVATRVAPLSSNTTLASAGGARSCESAHAVGAAVGLLVTGTDTTVAIECVPSPSHIIAHDCAHEAASAAGLLEQTPVQADMHGEGVGAAVGAVVGACVGAWVGVAVGLLVAGTATTMAIE